MSKRFWDTIGWNNNTYIFRSSKVPRIFVSAAVMLIVFSSAYKLNSITGSSKSAETEPSELSRLIGTDGSFSKGYEAGKIYSIDGAEIAETYTKSDGSYQKYCGKPGYNGILGSSGSGGAINEWYDVLHSSDNAVNRSYRSGDSIQTTLHSKGQETAAAELAEYCGKDVCESAALCVVLRDSSVLVAAGSNACTEDDYFIDERLNEVHANYCAEPCAIGSVTKIMTARMLLLHDDQLPEEYSLYNSKFRDVSYYDTPEGYRIHNYDYENPEAYSGSENDQFYRLVPLSDALGLSSNTYFLRHVYALSDGDLMQAYHLMQDTFGLNYDMQTDVCRLNAVACEEKRLPYFFFGQDFSVSPLRAAHLVNFALSGEAYPIRMVSAVYLPDGTELFHADPQPRSELGFCVEKDDLLREALADCFESYHISEEITAPYQSLIDNRRLLSKSGTADTKQDHVNTCRVLTVLDENDQVTATACILLHNQKNGAMNNDTLYKILLDSLDACGVIRKDFD